MGPVGARPWLGDVARPEWFDDALCRQVDPELFFPPKGGSAAPARAVCARCPVQAECLMFALQFPVNNDISGVYGGTTFRQRRRLRELLKSGGSVDVSTAPAVDEDLDVDDLDVDDLDDEDVSGVAV